MILIFPLPVAKGLGVFPQMEKRRGSVFIFMDFSCCKIVLYRFCYGSGIPAGLMVPLLLRWRRGWRSLCGFLQYVNLLPAEYMETCLVLGMASSFTAGERAPVTAIMLALLK